MAMAKVRRRAWRTADGSERAAFIADYVDQHGKRHIKTFPGAKGEKEADAWLVRERYKIAEGTHTPESTSAELGEAIDSWLARAEAEGLEFGTLQQYRQHKVHILKLIDRKTKLAKLTRARGEQFRDDLLQHHSRPMARKVLASFKSIVRDASRRGLVAQNVAAEITIGRNGRHRGRLEVGVDVPTPEELAAVLAKAEPKAKAMIALAARAGLRASELRGLKRSRIDLGSKPRVTVAERADKWGRVGAPKTSSSRRSVPLSAETAQTVREWLVAQPPLVINGEHGEEQRRPRALLFGTATDHPDMLGNLTKRVLVPAQISAGVTTPVLDPAGTTVLDDKGKPKVRTKYGWHSFRHYAISAWLAAGIDPKTVQQWAGHSSLMITVDTYGHFMPRTDDHARIEAAERALAG